jgi:glycine amidinotransferase
MADKPVCSYNEWDMLEEVIVGIVDQAMFPSWNTINKVTVPSGEWEVIEALLGDGGVPYPPELVELAQANLNEFVSILEEAGVTVRRPDPMLFAAPYSTPSWEVRNGFCAANPRDVFLVIGDEIIEAPMPDRGRYFEAWPYRRLLKEYFHAGARWTAAPKPQLLDDLYDADYQPPSADQPRRFILSEFEPVFDAADFVRCGRDLFGQMSHTTNASGIAWLLRHLGPNYRLHILESRCPQAMHIDSTFIPLAPGKVLVNPVFLDVTALPEVLKDWDVLIAPEPVYTETNPFGSVSGWINMNVLSLDEERVVVERAQKPMIRALEKWGFTPVPCAFESYYVFAGSFHCATLDVRRRGELQSYF